MVIYKITNLNNGKVYIGQSSKLNSRIKQHFSALKKGEHQSKSMQSDWNEGNQLSWEILEEVQDGAMNRELYWIEYYNSCNPEQGYNIIEPLKRGSTGVGATISRYRIQKGISQSAICKILGYDRVYYWRLEADKCRWLFEDVVKACDYLGISIKLITEEERTKG